MVAQTDFTAGKPTVVQITTSQTWVAPRTGLYRFRLVGAGAGGGRGVAASVAGNSGGGGEVLIVDIRLAANDSIPIVIGAGGIGATSGSAAGTAGGITTATLVGGQVLTALGGLGNGGTYTGGGSAPNGSIRGRGVGHADAGISFRGGIGFVGTPAGSAPLIGGAGFVGFQGANGTPGAGNEAAGCGGGGSWTDGGTGGNAATPTAGGNAPGYGGGGGGGGANASTVANGGNGGNGYAEIIY